MLIIIAVIVFAWLMLATVRLGVHQRLPLALAPISLDRIPDRAASRYGTAPLFTTDEPCGWDVPSRRADFPDATEWSAVRIRDTADHVASLLGSLGVRRDHRVVVFKRNHLDMHVFAAAIVRAGGIACPINNQFDAAVLGDYIARLGAETMISDPESLRRIIREGARLRGVAHLLIASRRTADAHSLEAAIRARMADVVITWIEEGLAENDAITADSSFQPVQRDACDVMYLVHSSGTTGIPKAVALMNKAQSHAVRGWLCYVHLSRTFDRGYLAVPNNHQAVMLTFHSALLLGLPVHWTTAYSRSGFDAKRVIRELADGRFTGYFGFPITYTQLKEVALESFDLRAMRFWAVTADASHETIQRRFAAVGGAFRSVGIPIDGSIYLDAQGSSEVGTPSVIRYVTRFTTRFDRRIGRPGSTPFGPAVRIACPVTGADASPWSVGRLEVRGRTLFAGYWKDEELTNRVIRYGWFFTGDVACYSDDGHIVQLDREVDVIHTAHGPVYSLPMEERIHEHPAVYDCCVYGARQPDGTELPAVAVAMRPGHALSETTLLSELNAVLDPSRSLVSVRIMPWSDFPIGVTGKTLKRVFRDWSEQDLARAAARAQLPNHAQHEDILTRTA